MTTGDEECHIVIIQVRNPDLYVTLEIIDNKTEHLNISDNYPYFTFIMLNETSEVTTDVTADVTADVTTGPSINESEVRAECISKNTPIWMGLAICVLGAAVIILIGIVVVLAMLLHKKNNKVFSREE